MSDQPQISFVSTSQEDGYRIFTLRVSIKNHQGKYQIYAFDQEIPLKEKNLSPKKLEQFAIERMQKWLSDNPNDLPKNKFLLLTSGGSIPTNDIESLLSVKNKVSDLIRTNVTISASLFEWARSKAKEDETSFSELVSRGLRNIKETGKEKKINEEVELWFNEQTNYFRNKLGDYGSYEFFHYLPNNNEELKMDLLKNVLQQIEIRKTGWPIGAYLNSGDQRPHPQADGINAEYTPSDYLLLDYWYAKNEGEFYFARNLESDSGNGAAEPKTSLYFDTLVWRVAEFIEHCLGYYKGLGIRENEQVKIKLSLNGLSGRTLSAWNPMRAITLRHYICDSDYSTWESEIEIKELQKNLDDVIYEAVKKLLLMFDFFVPNKEVVLDILNREYRKSNY